METELELHSQVFLTVPPAFEQVLEQSSCLANQLVQMKDADKEHDKNNLNLILLIILSKRTVKTFFFFFFFFVALLTHDIA